MRTSPNVADIKPSATLAVAALAKQLAAAGRDVVDLSAGEPDFPTPEIVSRAGIRAIEDGRTGYTPVGGTPEIRKAVAAELGRGRAVAVDPAGVVVSTGAKQALFNACFSLFGPGDRVLIPAPYWTSYPEIVRLARAEPVVVAGDEGAGHKLTPALLSDAAAGGAAGLLLNSPTNPSGAVYSAEELRAVVEWAHRNDVAVISDEIYNRICFTTDRAAGLLDLGPLHERDVVIGGASKNYAMTGWRIGYSYAGAEVTARIAAVQGHTTSNASTPSQYAAAVAFRGDAEADVLRMRDAFRARRDLVVSLFRDRFPEADFVQPDGAFYLFFRADSWYDDEARAGSVAFCRWLVEETGLALVPGEAFGDDRFVRLSYAASEAELRDGIDRLAAAVAGRPAASAGA